MLGLLPKRTGHVIVVLILLFLGINYVPIYFNAWQFYDESRKVVRFAGVGQQSVRQVRAEIIQLAEEGGVPEDEEDVKVEVVVIRNGAVFDVRIYYEVPVDLRLYQDLRTFNGQFRGETFEE